MKSKSLIAVTLLALAALTGCATPPQQHFVQDTREYGEPYDTAWSNLMAYFTSHNIQIKTIEKASGIVYAEVSAVGNAPDVADCGNPGIAPIVATAGQANVLMQKKDDGKIRVTVHMTFAQQRRNPFDNNQPPFTVPCTSLGVGESHILDAIGS